MQTWGCQHDTGAVINYCLSVGYWFVHRRFKTTLPVVPNQLESIQEDSSIQLTPLTKRKFPLKTHTHFEQ